MTEPNPVADDLETIIDVHALPAGEPEAGFARGHHAAVRQAVRNGDFSERPPYPDLPIDNLTNKLPGWELIALSGTAITARWIEDPGTGRGIVRCEFASGAAADRLALQQSVDTYELSYHPVIKVRDPSVSTNALWAETRAQYLAPDGSTVGTEGTSLQQEITFANLTAAPDQTALLMPEPDVGGNVPTGAAQVRIRFGVFRFSGTTDTGTVDFVGVSAVVGRSELRLVDLQDTATREPGVLQQTDGFLTIKPHGLNNATASLLLGHDGTVFIAHEGAMAEIIGDRGTAIEVRDQTSTDVVPNPPAERIRLYARLGTVYSRDSAGNVVSLSFGGTPAGGDLSGTYPDPTVDDDSHAHTSATVTPSGIGAAPGAHDYLVGTGHAGLTGEIVVGLTPGGELSGTWAAPTVDATHSGSAHSAFQPLDADLTAIAAVSTTAYGRSVLALADGPALRVLAGLGDDLTGGDGFAQIGPNAAATVGGRLALLDSDGTDGWNLDNLAGGTMRLYRDGVVWLTYSSAAQLTLNNAGSHHLMAAYVASAASTGIAFRKSRHATIGSHTVLPINDQIGSILFQGSDGTAFFNAAQIRVDVDATPGANDMPGRIVFLTTPDGSTTVTERMRIDSAGLVWIGSTTALASIATQALLVSTDVAAGNALTVRRSSAAGATQLGIAASRGTGAAPTSLADGDTIGNVMYQAFDGTNYLNVASVLAKVDGTPGTNDMPSRLQFHTTPDGGTAITERMRIDNAGLITMIGTFAHGAVGTGARTHPPAAAFPGSPVTNDRIYRTDRGIEYAYDGTRWLSTTLYSDPIDTIAETYTATDVDAARHAMPFPGTYDLWVTSVDFAFYVQGGTALDVSNSWALALTKQPANTTVATTTISAGAINAWRAATIAVGALIGTTNFAIFVSLTKTGTPGTLYVSARLNYRLVG